MANPSATDTTIRDYADRLILEQLHELHEVVKPTEIAEKLKSSGLTLGVIRSLLTSNSDRFAYAERRWVPAARLETLGRPLAAIVKTLVDRYGGPMPLELVVAEIARTQDQEPDWVEEAVREIISGSESMFLTLDEKIALDQWVFKANDESLERAFALNSITNEDVEAVEKALGQFDWRDSEAIVKAVEKVSPINAVALGAAAWKQLSPQDPMAILLYDWKKFNAELLSIPGFVYIPGGMLYNESETQKWVSATVKLADKLEPTIEVEDAAPLELKKDDIEKSVKAVLANSESTRAIQLLEDLFEVTHQVKTFPDDLDNMLTVLKADPRITWVGGDRFQKAGQTPDDINEVPAPFHFVKSELLQEDGDPVDAELSDEGLNSSLRKLIVHPLATDVLDEEILPAPKHQTDQLRLVLKPIHRELGTFPMSQFHTGWFDAEPKVQELIFINPQGQELQVWMNQDTRLLFNLFEWWLDQPVESGAVFQLTKTNKPNVFEFEWLDQTDPVVYISNQRMEELRESAASAENLSTFEILCQVMTHWPKGADFLTVLWEINVVRRTSRRLLASLLSSYVCFYQRSGSPVWHYDHKKVEQGFDKSKKKFIIKD